MLCVSTCDIYVWVSVFFVCLTVCSVSVCVCVCVCVCVWCMSCEAVWLSVWLCLCVPLSLCVCVFQCVYGCTNQKLECIFNLYVSLSRYYIYVYQCFGAYVEWFITVYPCVCVPVVPGVMLYTFNEMIICVISEFLTSQLQLNENFDPSSWQCPYISRIVESNL